MMMTMVLVYFRRRREKNVRIRSKTETTSSCPRYLARLLVTVGKCWAGDERRKGCAFGTRADLVTSAKSSGLTRNRN